MKVIQMFVPYEAKNKAKESGCRWDSSMNCWYVSLQKYNDDKDKYKAFRSIAFVDTNDVTNDSMKELGCKWNNTYKKWTVDKKTYETNQTQFDLYKLRVLSEITRVYNYVLPPVKSEEDQLAELIALMACDDEE